MDENDRLRIAISDSINKLQDIDFHSGTEGRKACIEVITNLRAANLPDEEISTLIQHYTQLRPSRIREYMRVEESDADKFANLVGKYGLPQRRRIVPHLPAGKSEEQK